MLKESAEVAVTKNKTKNQTNTGKKKDKDQSELLFHRCFTKGKISVK